MTKRVDPGVTRAAHALDSVLGEGTARRAPLAVAALILADALSQAVRARPSAPRPRTPRTKVQASEEALCYSRLCAAWSASFGARAMTAREIIAESSRPEAAPALAEVIAQVGALRGMVKLSPKSLGHFLRHRRSAQGNGASIDRAGWRDHTLLWQMKGGAHLN